MRFKNRYLLAQLSFEDNVEYSSWAVLAAIKEKMHVMYGDYGQVIGASLQIKYFSPDTLVAIIRVRKDYYQYVWAAMAFMTTLGKRKMSILVKHCSATIKSCQKHAVIYDKNVIEALSRNV